jgi:hypothetical protein
MAMRFYMKKKPFQIMACIGNGSNLRGQFLTKLGFSVKGQKNFWMVYLLTLKS